MKIIKTAKYEEIENKMKRNEKHSNAEISTYDFNEENKSGLLEMIKNLPHQKYEVKTFDTFDKMGFVLEFGNDLFIKINHEDREDFEKWAGFKIGDHVMVNFGEIK